MTRYLVLLVAFCVSNVQVQTRAEIIALFSDVEQATKASHPTECLEKTQKKITSKVT